MKGLIPMTAVTTDVRPAAPPAGARTLAGMAAASPSAHGDHAAIRFRRQGAAVEWSHAEFSKQVRETARGLIALGIEAGDTVAILGSTCPEWTVADCAALAAGATVVPIYHTNSPEECAYVLTDSAARAVICEDAGQLMKIAAVQGDCPALEHVIAMHPGLVVMSLEDLRARAGEIPADALDARATSVSASDVATIVYTSGTTGPPKGCLLTHANCIATMEMTEARLDLDCSAVMFLFLPLAHVLARLTQLVVLDVGGTLAFWSGQPAALLDDIAASRPTHVPSVPRLFEKIRTRALTSIEDAGAPRRKLFDWALTTGRKTRAGERAGSVGLPLRVQHAIADRLVLSKVRALFGGELQLALTGAAPIAQDVLEFFDACGVLVLEGWGMTETTAAGTLNTPEAFRFGTVGRPLPGTEVAIADDGEILVRGPNVFDGYHRNPAATAEAFADGWLLTGDLGALDADGFLRITGRKKDLIITSSGKNISPSNLEASLRESRWISHAMVAGDKHPYLVALLTLDAEEAAALAAHIGRPLDIPEMARDPRVLEVLQAEVDAVNRRVARIEQIKRFHVLEHDFTESAGELTPTLKLKRPVVARHFAAEIDALYA
jgi:long-chain acyl-CoA synthetase